MPQKRKRTEADSTAEETAAPSSTRATRSSTRATAAKGTSFSRKLSPAKSVPSKSANDAASDIAEDVPLPKKTRPTDSTATPSKAKATKASATKAPAEDATEKQEKEVTTAAKPARATKSKSKTKAGTHDQAPTSAAVAGEDEGSRKSKKLPMSVKSSTAKNIKPASSEISDGAPYSAAGALKLFARFADVEEPDVIGPEGLETLCTEAGVPMEGAQPLILAWQLGTKEMAKIRKEEWVKGMEDLRISSLKTLALALQDLEDLLILGKPPMQRFSTPPSKKATKAVPTENDGPYDRDRYFRYTFMKERAFLELYQFCFGLAKTEGSRNIDMETATAFWSVLVVPKYPITAEILDFINAKGTFKGVNKDLWNMTLEFCETVSPNLDNYEADGAWPTMLDEFVTWKKGKNGDEGENKAGEE